jgi:hypothetical protein
MRHRYFISLLDIASAIPILKHNEKHIADLVSQAAIQRHYFEDPSLSDFAVILPSA